MIKRNTLAGQALVHPNLQIGTKLQAIGFLIRTLAARAPDFDAFERDRGWPILADLVLSHDSAEWRANAERQQLNLLPDFQSTAPVLEVVG